MWGREVEDLRVAFDLCSKLGGKISQRYFDIMKKAEKHTSFIARKNASMRPTLPTPPILPILPAFSPSVILLGAVCNSTVPSTTEELYDTRNVTNVMIPARKRSNVR